MDFHASCHLLGSWINSLSPLVIFFFPSKEMRSKEGRGGKRERKERVFMSNFLYHFDVFKNSSFSSFAINFIIVVTFLYVSINIFISRIGLSFLFSFCSMRMKTRRANF